MIARVPRIHAFGGPEVISVDDVDVGEPGPGEVRIKVGGIGLGRFDTMVMGGGFGEIPLPALFGYEAAGSIERVGEGISDFEVGDRVAILPGLPMGYGACGETIIAPVGQLVRTPGNQSDIDAAATWMPYLTAYAVRAYRRIQPGDHVLITAASSSVGLAAIQLVKADGGIPIAITRSQSKAAALHQHGAAHVISTDHSDLAATVREITGERGAAMAFDAVAGADFLSITQSLGAGGMAIVYGSLGGDLTSASAQLLSFSDLTIRGFGTHHLMADEKLKSEAIDYIHQGIQSGQFRPVIDSTFDLDEISTAYQRMLSNEQVGKIVVTP